MRTINDMGRNVGIPGLSASSASTLIKDSIYENSMKKFFHSKSGIEIQSEKLKKFKTDGC